MKKALITVFGVLLIDQIIKFWIKTNMSLGQEFNVLGEWFIIHFTENKGMAFGMEFGFADGKLLLSLIRVVAIIGIIWYLVKLIREKVKDGLIIAIALILAGAVGNLIDSAFYGLIFSESDYFQVAQLMPDAGGYASFLHGSVVDMLYFPIWQGVFPTWFPVWGGHEFEFFRPVFNLADASISVGVSMLLVFQRRYFVNGNPAKKYPLEEEIEIPEKK